MLSHDPQAKIKRSIVRYIYIQAYIASIYIYISMGMYTYAGNLKQSNCIKNYIAKLDKPTWTSTRNFSCKRWGMSRVPFAHSPISHFKWGTQPHSEGSHRAQIMSSDTNVLSAPRLCSNANLPREGASPKFECVWGHVRRKVSHQDPLPSQLPGV